MSLIESLKWRYATKRFDPTKKVAAKDLAILREAIKLAATSYGLQHFKVLQIENATLRKALQKVSWNQSQIVDASHLFVFCNYAELTEEHIRTFANLKSRVQNLSEQQANGYADFIIGKLNDLNSEAIQNWCAKQIYLALGNLLVACADAQIDACPIEGFEPDQYDEILGLSGKGLKSVVVAAVGYRSEEDSYQKKPKVRKQDSDLFEVI
ncbi:MAG: NAD(P)H-dependent oxidoreductase [Flavobacteriales bacterium]|nr:NAD(P)H-dependent oxidoreductase [Flavobacteriales bacterium]